MKSLLALHIQYTCVNIGTGYYDRYDRRKRNFLYRKLFTPDLNVFLYTKVIYLSVISVIPHRNGIRKCAIYAS